MAISKSDYSLNRTALDIELEKIVKILDNDCVLVYIITLLNPKLLELLDSEIVIRCKDLLTKHNFTVGSYTAAMYSGTQTIANILDIARDKVQSKLEADIASNKITARTLYDLFSQHFLDTYGYKYSWTVSAKDMGIFKRMLSKYGSDRSIYVIQHAFTQLPANNALTPEYIAKIFPSVVYNKIDTHERRLGEW